MKRIKRFSRFFRLAAVSGLLATSLAPIGNSPSVALASNSEITAPVTAMEDANIAPPVKLVYEESELTLQGGGSGCPAGYTPSVAFSAYVGTDEYAHRLQHCLAGAQVWGPIDLGLAIRRPPYSHMETVPFVEGDIVLLFDTYSMPSTGGIIGSDCFYNTRVNGSATRPMVNPYRSEIGTRLYCGGTAVSPPPDLRYLPHAAAYTPPGYDPYLCDDGQLCRCSDGVDNDFDGRVDEELLDGYDNDRDGRVDEDTYCASATASPASSCPNPCAPGAAIPPPSTPVGGAATYAPPGSSGLNLSIADVMRWCSGHCPWERYRVHREGDRDIVQMVDNGHLTTQSVPACVSFDYWHPHERRTIYGVHGQAQVQTVAITFRRTC